MANESRFLELTAQRGKALGRKVSGVGKVLVNLLFFFFYWRDRRRPNCSWFRKVAGRFLAESECSKYCCQLLQDGEEEINVEQQVGVISLEMGLGLGAAV